MAFVFEWQQTKSYYQSVRFRYHCKRFAVAARTAHARTCWNPVAVLPEQAEPKRDDVEVAVLAAPWP